jgi:Predicted Zn peptidase
MEYEKYKVSRDLSWQIIIDQNLHTLPVKVSDLCRNYNITLGKYRTNEQLLQQLQLFELSKKSDGLTVRMGEKVFIFYNDSNTPARQRFTVAHELGHFFLKHEGIQNGSCAYSERNSEPSYGDEEPELQANVFASRILAPACVLWGMQLHTAEEIAKVCDISMQSAHFRLDRLNQLYARETAFLKRYGKSCFLRSPLEQKVYHQFREFIERKGG